MNSFKKFRRFETINISKKGYFDKNEYFEKMDILEQWIFKKMDILKNWISKKMDILKKKLFWWKWIFWKNGNFGKLDVSKKKYKVDIFKKWIKI